MRQLYTILFYLSLPFVFLRLLIRSRKLPDYRKRLAERLGIYSFKLEQSLWIHTVSVGEFIAAVPLIKKIKVAYSLPILITTMTPTGASRVKAEFGNSVYHVYIPYDVPFALNRFIKAMRPIAGIIMETELWPNLLYTCNRHHIPVVLLNARLSEKSARNYQKIESLTKQMLSQLYIIAAHAEADAKRFVALGADEKKVKVTGSIKFDLNIPVALLQKSAELRNLLGNERFVWIAASTHPGEEELILDAHKELRNTIPNALLILVPRHPDRFNEVMKLSSQQFLTNRRTQASFSKDAAVYLGDTMGELLLLYAAADIAFVGGSLVERGGHNILEPAALKKPVLTGPALFNFQEMSELFLKADAMLIVKNTHQLAAKLVALQDAALRNQFGERAFTVFEQNKGALQKQFEIVQELMDSAKSVRCEGGIVA